MGQVPEFYADNWSVMDNGVTAQFLYKVTPPVVGPSAPESVVVVRVPVALLKLNAFLLRRYVLQREVELGEPISVPKGAFAGSQIALEDWTLFWGRNAIS